MTIECNPPVQKYMRAAGVCKTYQIAKSTLWNWVATREDFPRPIKAGPRVTLFDVQALERFIAGSAA